MLAMNLMPQYSITDISWTLSQLLDELKNTAESLPFVNQLFIDYVWQEDEETFLIEEVSASILFLSFICILIV